MELKKFADELLLRMNAALEQISTERDGLVRTSRMTVCVEASLSELMTYVYSHPFINDDEEIFFFKAIKPMFASGWWYNKWLFKVQLFERYHSAEENLEYFHKRLHQHEQFLQRHLQFYRYMLSGRTDRDSTYFTRRSSSHAAFAFDHSLSTPHDVRYSKMLAIARLNVYLTSAIQEIQSPSVAAVVPTLTWTGSKTDLIELIYALHAADVLHKNNSDVKQIATAFEYIFNVNLGNYYRVFQDIKLRKIKQLKFIDSLRESLLSKINEMDA